MFRVLVPLLALAIAFPSPALAGAVDLRFVDQGGQPIADVVVTVNPAGGVGSKPISFPWGTAMVQKNIAFNPHVLIVPVGATVAFPNQDKVRHHVYSFSKPAKFELKLYGNDQTRSYTFRSPGAVALGCNIHDAMRGYIKVVDTPYAARSGALGTVRIGAIPDGRATLTVWHPMLRSKDNEIVTQQVFTTGGVLAQTITLALRPGR